MALKSSDILNKSLCRQAINNLKSGNPPPEELVPYLCVGCEPYLDRIQQGLNLANSLKYDIILVEAGYGRGKSNLISYSKLIAKQQNFKICYLEVGSNNIFFNKPSDIINHFLRDDDPITRKEINDFSKRHWISTDRNQFAMTCVKLQILADRALENGKNGLILLFDELENTFHRKFLQSIISRRNAYQFLDIFFNGGYLWHDSMNIKNPIDFKGMFVVMAITPNTIEQALSDGPTSWYYTGEFHNPAKNWKLPDFLKIEKLSQNQAFTLAKRIQKIHNIAFNWDSGEYINENELRKITDEWHTDRTIKSERYLIKTLINKFETIEQNR